MLPSSSGRSRSWTATPSNLRLSSFLHTSLSRPPFSLSHTQTQAAAAADTAPATYDCLRGCTLTKDLVCGSDGLTYMGACLAICGGTTVLHPGACGPPPAPGGGRPFEPAAFPGPPSDHPLAGAFDLSGSAEADGGGEDRAVDAPALTKFEGEGLALVGLAAIGRFNLSQAEERAGAALAARAAAEAADGAGPPPPITDRRVLSVDFESGLLYASKAPVPEGAGAQAAAETAGAAPPGEEAGDAPAAAADPPAMTPDFQPARWTTLTSTPAQPYRRAVWLDFGCSGAVIGPHAVGTAAHCLYSVGSGFVRPYTARPGAYRPSGGGAPVSPFGAYPSRRFLVLAGWSGAGSQAAAWAYDAGVVITKGGDMVARVGRMGFAYSPSGPTGTPLMTAGYPQTTQAGGKLVHYGRPCTTTDANGRDVSLRTQVATCPICEGGQSGSPLWVGGGSPVIRAVLSRGTDDYDIWAELSKQAYDLWARSKELSA